jgi:hypothetical protein
LGGGRHAVQLVSAFHYTLFQIQNDLEFDVSVADKSFGASAGNLGQGDFSILESGKVAPTPGKGATKPVIH